MDPKTVQSNRQNRFSMFLAFLVVVSMMVAVAYNGWGLVRRLQDNRARKEQLLEEIRQEEERAEQIETYRKFTKTDEFVEQIARERLGLIKEGELIFREAGGQ